MSAIATDELHALNFRTLLLAQQAAKQDVENAVRMFGLTEDIAHRIASMSYDQLGELSKTNALLFHCRINESLVEFSARAQSPALRAILIEARSAQAC